MICAVMFAASAYAADQEFNITVKQGAIMTWDDARVKNLTTFETAKTRAIEGWGKWNILWDGWVLDAGFAYDAATIDTVALMIGREFGTIGNYLPIDFPLKDKVSVTIYPVGLYVGNIWDKAEWKPCSGGAIIKLKVSF